MTFSVLLHALALAAGVAHSVWQVEEMAMPAIEVTLSMAPPPPPPPPPPPKRKSSKPKTKPTEVKPKTIVAPTETAKAEEPEAAEEESSEDEEGEDEGEEGGVVGGVVGGIVGGTAPPPPPSSGPKLLSTKAGHSLLAINPQRRPYKVNVPEEYVSRGDEYVTQVRICVSPQGAVSSVKILRPSIPAIDLQIPRVLSLWKYKPFIVDGRPAAFCYPMNYRVR